MDAVDMPDVQELVARLVALRDSLLNTSQVLRDLQYQMDLEGQQQAGDSVGEMLERFVAKPDFAHAGPAALSRGLVR